MLFNLLPGLREIRAPLISGYLWLAFFFLAFHGELPSSSDPGSVLEPIFSIGEDLSAAGLGVITGVAAYLVGSAMQELWKLMGRLFSPGRPLYGEAGIRTSPTGRRDVHSAVRARMQSVSNRLSQVALSPGERGIAEEPDADSIEQELPLIRTLLLGERPELVGELDRLQAEADLRITVAFPLAFFAVYLAFEVSLGWIALLLPAVLLLIQGYQRQLDAGDLLAKALKIGKADAPTLETLATSAEAALERVELEADLRRRMDEGDGLAAFQLGNLQASWDDFETAAASLEFAVEKGVFRAYAELGLVYERCGDDEKAERAWRDGVQRRDEKSRTLLTALLHRLDRGEEARAAASEAEEKTDPKVVGEAALEIARGNDYRQRMEEGDPKAALNLGLLLRRHGQQEEAAAVLRRATELDREDSQVRVEFGKAEATLGRFGEAKVALEQALRLQEQQLDDPEHLDVAAALYYLAQVLDELGQHEDARELHERALGIREKHLGKEHPDVANSLAGLASNREAFDEFEDARRMEERALSILQGMAPGPNPNFARVLSNLGWTYRGLGRYEHALDLQRRALEMEEQLLSSDDPQAAITRGSVGALLGDLGEYANARTHLEEADEVLKANGAAAAHHHAEALRELGRVLTLSQRPDRAIRLFAEGLEIETERFGRKHPRPARTLTEMGAAQRQLGDIPASERSYSEALSIFRSGPKRSSEALVLRGLGETLSVSGRETKAVDLIRQAIAIQEDVLRKGHPQLADSLDALAAVFQRLGRVEQAQRTTENAAAIRTRS